MRVTTRVGRGGEVSAPRDMPLLRRLMGRVRRWAARRPRLVCTDGVVAYLRAMRETCRDPVPGGTGGRPRRRPWHHGVSAPVGQRDERRRVVETDRRMVDGTPARVEARRCRSPGDGVSHTADLERLHATVRERLAPLARHTLTWHAGMCLVGTVDHGCTPQAS
jgi:IS1 family transposase